MSDQEKDVKTVSLLKQLSEAYGVSGYEEEVRAIVRGQFDTFADEVRVDAMGNLIALKKGRRRPGKSVKRIMLAGHMDEIGLIVTVLEKGFIRFTQVGGFDVRTLPGREVLVHGKRRLPGVIGCRPPHVLNDKERKKPVPMDELFIDTGLTAGALAKNVRPGDLISIRGGFTELQNGHVSGKAFDDRASVTAIACCMEQLRSLTHTWDVYAVATVQEEVGLRGAITGAYGVAPDIGIAIDVGFGKQPGIPEALYTVELGKGPALCSGPNIHPEMFAALRKTAQQHEIPFQTEICTRGTGTDANAIQLTRAGIPTALLSIPLRSMHTPVEMLQIKDVERTGRLLAHFIAGLDDAFTDKLAWKIK